MKNPFALITPVAVALFSVTVFAEQAPSPPPAVEPILVTPEDVAREVEPMKPAPAGSEYIILCGGPALKTWEKTKRRPHDNTWANFINAAEVRWKQIKPKAKKGDVFTWLIYRPGYEQRGKEDGVNLIQAIENRARTLGVNVKWFGPSFEVIDHLNGGYPRDTVKIANFDYFGHSNKNCWMFDYSNNVDGCSNSFIHIKDLPSLSAGIFLAQAHVKSWGCHSAEAFTAQWKKYTGTTMIGTVGKTDYSTGGLPKVTRARGWSS